MAAAIVNSNNVIFANGGGGSGIQIEIESPDNSITVSNATVGSTEKYKLSVNTDVVATKESVDEVKAGLNNLTGTVDNHAAQIGQIQEDINDIDNSLSNKKDRQPELNFAGSATKTVKSITQDANGVINVEYENIDFVRGDSNVEIKSEDNSVNVVESTDSQTNTKTYDLSVADSIKSKIKDITITNDTLVIIGD